MDTLFKTQIFVEVFLREEYEYAVLRKELLIPPFVEHFKTINLGKSYLQILWVLEPIYLSIAFFPYRSALRKEVLICSFCRAL